MKKTPLMSIPQIEKLLNTKILSQCIDEIGRSNVSVIASDYLDEVRQAVKAGGDVPSFDECVCAVLARCANFSRRRIKRVVNATGVALHTNLGRSPLPQKAWDVAKLKGAEYSSIEMDLYSGKRGGRFQFLREGMAKLLDAESSIILNNNAAAVFLMLKALAEGKKVIVPRGQQVQIGGGFRVPEIMAMAGVQLVEVGTTNITTIEDIKNAITDDVAMVLYVHTSNYKIRGFTEMPSIREIKENLPSNVILAVDQGSGNLFFNIPDEPTCKGILKEGADLVCFSGDKLFGGPQAGWIVGKECYTNLIAKHQLMRTYRIGKAVASLMEEVLIHYLNGGKPFAIQLLEKDKEETRRRVASIVDKLPQNIAKVKEATFSLGGGTSPDVTFPTYAIELDVDNPEHLKLYLRTLPTPIIAIISDSSLLLHLITVKESDDYYILQSLQDYVQSLVQEASEQTTEKE